MLLTHVVVQDCRNVCCIRGVFTNIHNRTFPTEASYVYTGTLQNKSQATKVLHLTRLPWRTLPDKVPFLDGRIQYMCITRTS